MNIPLPEQLEEIASEYTRRCQAYPLLVAQGRMRQDTADFKIERMAAAHNTLTWLLRNADQIKEWVQYAAKVTPKAGLPEITSDLPAEVIPAGVPELCGDFDDSDIEDLTAA
jgi:hypothetical protein